MISHFKACYKHTTDNKVNGSQGTPHAMLGLLRRRTVVYFRVRVRSYLSVELGRSRS